MTTLSDPLARLPRPGGNPDAIIAGLSAWARVAADLGAQGRLIASSAHATVASWQGVSGEAFRSTAAALGGRFGAASHAVGEARAALLAYSDALRRAQHDWDRAAGQVANDDAAQARERDRVCRVALLLDNRHSLAVANAQRHCLPAPAPPLLPQWEPDPLSWARRAAAAQARTAIEAVNDAARVAIAALQRAGELIWPAQTMPAGDIRGWSPYRSLRAGTRSDWLAATSIRGAIACPTQSFYQGRGFIEGPDHRHYALTVPSLRTADAVYTGEPATPDAGLETLFGADPGWRTVYELDGLDVFGVGSAFGTKLLGSGYGKLGPWRARPEALSRLVIGPSGRPSLPSAGSPAGPSSGPPDSPLEPRRVGDSGEILVPKGGGGGQRLRLSPLPQLPAGPETVRRGTVRGGVGAGADVVASAAGAVDTWLSIDDRLKRTYLVKFQEHPDGRLRAILRSYMVTDVPGYRPVISPRDVYFDSQGNVTESLIRWRPSHHPVIAEDDPGYVIERPGPPPPK